MMLIPVQINSESDYQKSLSCMLEKGRRCYMTVFDNTIMVYWCAINETSACLWCLVESTFIGNGMIIGCLLQGIHMHTYLW